MTHAPVVDRENGRVVGVVTLAQLLHGRRHDLTEEQHRERLLLVSSRTTAAGS